MIKMSKDNVKLEYLEQEKKWSKVVKRIKTWFQGVVSGQI
jgi:hypothetical protein